MVATQAGSCAASLPLLLTDVCMYVHCWTCITGHLQRSCTCTCGRMQWPAGALRLSSTEAHGEARVRSKRAAVTSLGYVYIPLCASQLYGSSRVTQGSLNCGRGGLPSAE